MVRKYRRQRTGSIPFGTRAEEEADKTGKSSFEFMSDCGMIRVPEGIAREGAFEFVTIDGKRYRATVRFDLNSEE